MGSAGGQKEAPQLTQYYRPDPVLSFVPETLFEVEGLSPAESPSSEDQISPEQHEAGDTGVIGRVARRGQLVMHDQTNQYLVTSHNQKCHWEN